MLGKRVSEGPRIRYRRIPTGQNDNIQAVERVSIQPEALTHGTLDTGTFDRFFYIFFGDRKPKTSMPLAINPRQDRKIAV